MIHSSRGTPAGEMECGDTRFELLIQNFEASGAKNDFQTEKLLENVEEPD